MKYILIAQLEHTPNGNFVISWEGEENFQKYNQLESWCDHCKKRIYRKISYIFRDEEGNEVQVGSSCINHYLDDEPTAEEEIILKSTYESFQCGRETGLFSFGKSSGYYTETIALVYIMTNQNPKDRKFDYSDWLKAHRNDITKEAKDTYAKMVEFYATFEPKTIFENNVKMAVLNGCADTPSYAKWAYKIYLDMLRYASSPSTKLEDEQFTIKEIWVDSEGREYMYDYRGTPYKVYRLYTTNNNLVEFKTSSTKDFLSYTGREVKCKIKSSYSSRKGEVTVIKNLSLAKGC